MFRKALITGTAVSALLVAVPALARPSGGIWDRAPRAKKVKKPQPAAEAEQAGSVATPAEAAPAANAVPPPVGGPAPVQSINGASAASNGAANGTECTAAKPC